jgi:predicted metal-binding protein
MYDPQRLAAMDDCEHATGKTLAQHIKERRTAKDVIAEVAYDECYQYSDDNMSHSDADSIAAKTINALRAAGYSIVQVVQTGNKPFP